MISFVPGVFTAEALGFPWPTRDPFLFCVHHLDFYPPGNEQLGPKGSLGGRDIGQDFTIKDGWRMYHGQRVPGFPQHPHRGFETITIARQGFIDHSDSLGATARFGQGDVQWMTAGSGIVHSEMFPLLQADAPNTVELFQIWLNLPSSNKMVEPYFSMFWNDSTGGRRHVDAAGRGTQVRVMAGSFDGRAGPKAPPDSWAAQEGNEVCILILHMEPHARVVLPPARATDTNRSLYFFVGEQVVVAQQQIDAHCALHFHHAEQIAIENGPAPAELLLLQGRPIGEPVVQYGPFVMNTKQEIRQAMLDYQSTRYGGWPWPDDEPVHAVDAGRFARHADGRLERPADGGTKDRDDA